MAWPPPGTSQSYIDARFRCGWFITIKWSMICHNFEFILYHDVYVYLWRLKPQCILWWNLDEISSSFMDGMYYLFFMGWWYIYWALIGWNVCVINLCHFSFMRCLWFYVMQIWCYQHLWCNIWCIFYYALYDGLWY